MEHFKILIYYLNDKTLNIPEHVCLEIVTNLIKLRYPERSNCKLNKSNKEILEQYIKIIEEKAGYDPQSDITELIFRVIIIRPSLSEYLRKTISVQIY